MNEELLLVGTVSVLQDAKNSGDGLHKNKNVLNATELYG